MNTSDIYMELITEANFSFDFKKYLALASDNAISIFYNAWKEFKKKEAHYLELPNSHPDKGAAYNEFWSSRLKQNSAAGDVVISAKNIGSLRATDYRTEDGKFKIVDNIKFDDCIVGRDRDGVIREYWKLKNDQFVKQSVFDVPSRISLKIMKHHPVQRNAEESFGTKQFDSGMDL